MISIVSPVYNAARILPELVNRITAVCEENHFDYEIVLVDDCSRDDSWEVVKSLCRDYPKLRAFKFSRNFGQHYAITAGISKATGEIVVLMDCDLQDNPVYIPELLKRHGEGFNVVCTVKRRKEYSWHRRLTSDLYFLVLNKLSDVRLEKNLGSFTLIDRKVADEFLKIKDYHRHISLVIAWLGFKRGFVEVVHEPRFEGKSSYNLRKLLALAVNGIISNSDKLLRWSISLGMLLFLASLLGVVYILIKSLYVKFDAGWPSLFVLILATTGIILFMLGISGLYIGKIFEQVKERPLFIIEEEAGKGT